jgi:DNA-binding transcriptional LysR family regulator
MLEQYQIGYSLALCETLNFARVAERRNVFQLSLTHAAQNLG